MYPFPKVNITLIQTISTQQYASHLCMVVFFDIGYFDHRVEWLIHPDGCEAGMHLFVLKSEKRLAGESL
jgi:hypothetical protein